MGTGNSFFGKKTNIMNREEFSRSNRCGVKRQSHDNMLLCVKFEKGTIEYDHLEKEYISLCDETLLKRCMSKLTQNPNESFHYRVWGYCPKVKALTLPVMEFAIAQSILHYHKGYEHGHLCKQLNIPMTKDMKMIWKMQETGRVRLITRKKARRKRKHLTKRQIDFAYEAGAFPRIAPKPTLSVNKAKGSKGGKSAKGNSVTLWDLPGSIKKKAVRGKKVGFEIYI